MESISRLRQALFDTFSGKQVTNGGQALLDELMVAKPRLLKLFDVGARNQQEQREIESGKALINGKQVAVNAEFARQVIFLSQQLECSERYIAGLLQKVVGENPNVGPVDSIELAVSEYHQRRRHLADSLRYIYEATIAEAPDATLVYSQIHRFVREELQGLGSQGVEDSLSLKIIKEFGALDTALSKTDAARKSARSNTVAPSAQGGGSLGADILNAPILAAFDPADPKSFGAHLRNGLANDATTVSYMKQKLGPSTIWKEPGLKATVLLKWTLFLTDFRHRNPNIEHRDGFKTDQLEAQIWSAVQGDCFAYLAAALIHLERKQGSSSVPSLLTSITLTTEQVEQRDLPTDDFKPAVLNAFETLIRSLLTHASSELRKIKQRQEDVVLSSARTDRTRGNHSRFSTAAPESTASPRNDIGMLYSLIGILYSSLPAESALQFWGSGPPVDSARTSYMEYLESTAGKLPAFLQWAIWSTPVHDATMMMALYDMLAGLAKGQQSSELAYNFLARGGGEVIQGSTLPSSSTSGSSLSWATVFDVLDTWASSANTSRTQPVQPLGQSLFGAPAPMPPPPPAQQPVITPKDVLLAQSFLRLLSTVVTFSISVRVAISSHVHFRAIPTLVSLLPLSIPLELKGALFEALSAFCRPGAGPAGVEICRAVWTMMERLEVINVRASLQVGFGAGLLPTKGVEVELEEIEAAHGLYPATIPFLKLLMSLTDRIIDSGTLGTIPETLGQPYRLPGISPFVGFIPMREYLRPSDRWKMNDLCLFDLESLLAAAENGQLKGDVLIPLLIHPGSGLQRSILSYLGFAGEEYFFASTIVRIQDIFLDGASSVGTIHPRSYFTKFDQSLSFGPQYVPALASYVAYPAYPELVLLSVRIIGILSSSTSLPNLAILIEQSDNSERILAGFMNILETESTEDVIAAEAATEQTTGAGAPDMDDSLDLSQATRLANTPSTQSHLNIAHFLLFGSTKKDQQIQDPHALGAQKTCVHVILDLLNAGVPRLKGKGKDRDFAPFAAPMFIRLPALAERCYRIIYQLYLRTREDFFARHLAAVPSKAPEALADPFIEVLYGDGTRVTATVSSFSSFLRSRSWIFDLNNQKGIAELLSILFGSEPTYDNRADWEDGMLRTFHEVGQSHMRIIEFLHLTFLGQLNLQACARKDVSGCEIIDRSALRALYSPLESAYVLESCAVENHRREIVHATATGFESWRRMLDMTENMLFDLLHESTAVLLAEMTLSAITKLREDRHHQVILQTVAGDHEASSLPAERLHVELVRGNLYASIVNYPQLPHSASLALSMSTSLSSIPVTPRGQTNLSTSPIQGHLERLVTMISRDAIDGTEVWKTLSAAEKQYSVLLCLVRHGILSNFVHVLKPDPDDLNALYVYESKMSLFIRIAQSRIGAERLLEANVVTVLAQSDFLDARPEGDQAFIDQDSFLPSAVQRYHQLFMPALELVNAVVAVLGSKHSSASNQALDFLSMHSPTIVILLKNEIDDISLSLLEEIHLLVSLCTNVLPLVPKTELASTNSGFGAIHAAILSLSTRCLGTGTPITDAEMLSASVLSSGFSSETRFDVNVRQKERLLRKALVAYIGSASEFTATLPTLGDAIEALNGVYNDLAETLKQISDISAELAMKDHIGVENIEQVIRDGDTEIIRDLDVAQKRSLICRELERMRDDLQDDVKTAIHTTEMILLLLWRHMLYYCDETRTKSSEKAYAIRLLSMPDPQSFRQDVGNKLRPVLQRLKSLVGPNLLGKEWRDNQAYIEIMDRRLRDTAGLHDINADEMDY
ncbi:hypothetical protein EV421DRAFT_1829501 [Armillaria borealis]|uniref:Nucleoporin Nup186/Nup192/Nup205 n=1 Tax=Armillaria borealis TaxID=47425 RepID=A0AA39MKB9_9AGAR|nr:hypothetical protein EV421DRAFT_1829501 [Armillaria borealis]